MHDYIAQQITDAPIILDPFPYIMLTKIFPDDVFQTILKSIPHEKHFTAINDALYNSRYMLDLSPSSLTDLPDGLRDVWMSVYEALCHPSVKKALLNKLSPGLSHRFGVPESEVESLEVFPKPTLYMDKDGYGIKPHPDSSKKVITMQIYLPEDDTQEALGTSFYRLSVKGIMNKVARGFEKVETMKFLPNYGYAFPVVKSLAMTSWHGREHIESTGKRPRLSILHMYYAKEEYGPGL